MNQGNRLPSTVQELSRLLEIRPAQLCHLAKNPHLYYLRGEKVKPDGRVRVFYKPYGELKKLQRMIHRKILKELPVHDSIHSYRKKRDQRTNALPHVGKLYMVKSDIKDFFPSIKPKMVLVTLLKLGFPEPTARILLQLTTYLNQLPQGPPTSPGIADLVLFPLARRFEGLCLKHGATFTIYGDDITISGSERILKLKNLFMRIIMDEGYTLHPDKIHVSRPSDKKKVTGVVVNKRLNIDKEYYRILRSQIHNCRIKGPAPQFKGDLSKARNSLLGKINHVKRLNANKGKQLMDEFSLINWE